MSTTGVVVMVLVGLYLFWAKDNADEGFWTIKTRDGVWVKILENGRVWLWPTPGTFKGRGMFGKIKISQALISLTVSSEAISKAGCFGDVICTAMKNVAEVTINFRRMGGMIALKKNYKAGLAGDDVVAKVKESVVAIIHQIMVDMTHAHTNYDVATFRAAVKAALSLPDSILMTAGFDPASIEVLIKNATPPADYDKAVTKRSVVAVEVATSKFDAEALAEMENLRIAVWAPRFNRSVDQMWAYFASPGTPNKEDRRKFEAECRKLIDDRRPPPPAAPANSHGGKKQTRKGGNRKPADMNADEVDAALGDG